jgi:hypothetical protein
MTIEAPLLEFATKRTLAEVWRVLLKWQLLRPVRLVGWVIGLSVGLYFILNGNGFYRGVGFFGLSIVVLYPLFFSLALWRVVAKDPIITEPTTISIFPWGIRCQSTIRSVSLAWENFDSFVQTESLIILRLRTTKQVVIVPKRDLDAAQVTTLLAILSRQYPAK